MDKKEFFEPEVKMVELYDQAIMTGSVDKKDDELDGDDM